MVSKAPLDPQKNNKPTVAGPKNHAPPGDSGGRQPLDKRRSQPPRWGQDQSPRDAYRLRSFVKAGSSRAALGLWPVRKGPQRETT